MACPVDEAAPTGSELSIPLASFSSLAQDSARWKAFVERWGSETDFEQRLGLFRAHLGAEIAVVAEIAEIATNRKIKRLVGYSSASESADESQARALAEAAAKWLKPEHECLCVGVFPPEPGAAPFPAGYFCMQPESTPGLYLLMVIAFDDRAKAELVSPLIPFLCPLVLESAKLAIEQLANLSIDRTLQQSQRLASGRLASGVAHDFNNLLTVIQGSVALLESQLADHSNPRVHESIRQLDAAGNRATALARQLLLFSHGKKQLPMIFDPFLTTKEQGKGTGLGLPNTQALAEKNRGEILVESGVGKGTRFEQRLPLAPPLPAAASADTEGVESPAKAEVAAIGSQAEGKTPKNRFGKRPEETGEGICGETVLLVEDDSSVRKLVRRLLEFNGCLVIEASSGREAMARWPEIRDSVSLVVSDVIMPGGVSGWDLARSLHEDRPELGILLTSGYTDHGGDENLKSSKQVEFLQKPYEAKKLRDTLCRLLHPAA